MSCCCCGDGTEVEPLQINGRVASAPGKEGFSGPVKDRGCTDVLCLILFIAFCIFGIVYIFIAFAAGDPARLIHGFDNYGNVCSRKNEPIKTVAESGKNYTDYKFHNLQDPLNPVCVKSCPDETTVLGYKCLPDIQDPAGGGSSFWKELKKELSSALETLVMDIQNAWQEILGICFIGLGLSILTILLLRFLAGIVVWVAVVLIAVISVGGTIALWVIWSRARGTASATPFLVGAIFATIFTVILLILLIAMRNRIRLVIQLFKEAGKAISSMPLLLLQPIWTMLILILVVGLWASSWLPIESSGTFVARNKTGPPAEVQAELKKDKFIEWMRLYHLFGFFWVTQFVIACHIMVIAGAVSIWYFSRDKSRLGTPILTSVGRVVRFHLGSIAFGSLIIAIIKMIRLLLKYIEKRFLKGSETMKWLCCVCQCCLYCFEKCIKFLSRNAYIEIAIYGVGFCEAAKKAFTTLANNALRVATLNFVGDFVLLLFKLVIVASTVLIGELIMRSNTKVKSPVPALVVVGVVTYLVAYCFISVYEMTIDTLFLCFCEDCEINDGIDKPYFMSKGLMKFVENSKKAIEALEERNHDAENNNLKKMPPNIHTIQIPPHNQQSRSPAPSVAPTPLDNGTGMTPLHPGYPPVSVPPSPSQFLPRPE